MRWLKTLWCLPVAFAALPLESGLAQTVAVQTQIVPTVEAPAAAVPVVAGQRDPLMLAIIAEIEARMAAEKDPDEKAHLSQLAGHYRVSDMTPLWVSESGLTDAGAALRDELARADQYGLDPAQFLLPTLPINANDLVQRAKAEADLSQSAVIYAWHARGGRVDPSQLSRWLDAHPKTIYASDVFRAIAEEGDPVAGLRSFHPTHPQFERLRQAYLAERGDVEPAPVAAIPAGDRIDVGDRHPDIELIRRRLGAEGTEDNANLLDRSLMGRIREFMYDQGYGRKRFVDDDVRAALNRAAPQRRGVNRALLDKYLVNLERWRTLPNDMGKLHVWNNLPEFLTRVVKNDQVIHEERIIIGKENTQTPVFSDTMSHVIFQPEWGVPESIKIRSILPHLRGGDYGVLARRGMAIKDGKRVISPSRYRWSKTDIRNVPIIQGPGPGNPLGRLKFIFPNGHDVYMHDTPDKHLFNSSERTFSHGCVRVRNPDRFAEVLLGEIEGWSADDVQRQLKVKTTTQIDLAEHIPVHLTYLTTWVSDDGTVRQFKDIYSHDKRYSEALAGKSIKLIAARDPAMVLKRQNDELRKNGGAIALAKPKPAKRLAVAAQPFAPSPWLKQSLGKPVKSKKYFSPVAPPRLLWFQQY